MNTKKRYSLFVKRESEDLLIDRTINDSRLTIHVIIFLLLFTSAGCTPSSSFEDAFVVGIESAPTQLDPRFATDAISERIGQLLFSRLVRFDPEGQIVPDLAERWEVEAGIDYTFYLKKNVLFHDGHPLTSEDVRYTYESMLDAALASPHRKAYEVILRIETPDSSTVRFILNQPYAPFLNNMTRGIIPRHLAEKPATFSSHPVGSGPFRFSFSEPDNRIELTAYPHYFEGPPPLSRLVFRVIPEDSVRLLELEKGNIDLIQNAFPPDALPRLQSNPRLKVIQSPGTTYAYLGFNLKDPILRRKEVRQAIAHAIDREEMTKHLLKGLARPATGLLPPSHWAYKASVPTYPYDPRRARALLDEAGFPDPAGPSPRFKLIHKTSQNELARRAVEVLQQQLGEIGILVEIRSFEWGTFYSDIRSGRFQMFTLQWVGIDDPDIYSHLFHSASIPPYGANRGFYQNTRIDQLVETGRITLDPLRRKAIYGEVQQIIAQELPYVSLWHINNVAVMKQEVEGYILYPDGDFYSLKETKKQARSIL